jgi:hypothetical protein
MKLVCDTCAKPAVGATVFHRRDALVRVECDECHARGLSPRFSSKQQRIMIALWLVLLASQVPSLISWFPPS